MSIIRVRKNAKYFTASNEPFNDQKLSWEARGLMGYLLSKPDEWEIRFEDLLNKGPAKEHKLRRMLAELRVAGYMNRIRHTLAGGTFDWTTEVYESPSQNPQKTTSTRFSTSGSATSGKPRDVLNTDSVITERKRGAHTLDFSSMSIPEARSIPTIKMFTAATNFFPGAPTWKYIHEFITENKISPETLKTAYEAWMRKGFRRENVEGILEWAKNGIPTHRGDKPTSRAAPVDFQPEKIDISPMPDETRKHLKKVFSR